MKDQISLIAQTALVSLVAGSISAPFVFTALLKAKSRQTISQHIQEHAHKQGTPTMGGFIILVGLIAGLVSGWSTAFLGLSIIILGYGAIGLFDDYFIPRFRPGSRGFEWLPKLGLQTAVALSSLWVAEIHMPIQLAVGTIGILFFCNAFNFSDGLDGLAGGLGVLLAVGTIGINLVAGHFDAVTIVTCSALIGAFVPFLFLNAPPARLFMGDVGSLPIGGIFGFLWFRYLILHSSTGNVGSLALPWLILAGVMLAEILPVPIQIASVKIRKERAFPFKTPIHHGFQEKGWPETRIVYAFYLVQLSLVLVACFVAGIER